MCTVRSRPRRGSGASHGLTYRSAVALLALTILLTGCESSGTGDASAGQALYVELCLDCHGGYGELTVEKRARPLRELTATDITDMLKKYQNIPDDAPWWTEFKGGLTNAQIGDLLAYLGTLKASH